jgi:hypothetical protein
VLPHLFHRYVLRLVSVTKHHNSGRQCLLTEV